MKPALKTCALARMAPVWAILYLMFGMCVWSVPSRAQSLPAQEQSLSAQKQSLTKKDIWAPGFSSQQIHLNKEGMKSAADEGFRWIEIRIGNTLKRNPQISFESLVRWAKKTKAQLDSAGIRVWSCHFPFGPGYDISTLDEAKNQKAVEYNIACLELAKIFEAHVGVIHSSDEGVKPEEREQRLKMARKSLEQLAPAFQKAGLPMAVEILPRVMLGNTSKELDRLIKGLPNTGITLDLNHIFYEKQEDVIRYFKDRIYHVHFSDFNGQEQHWNPLQGTMNWPAIMRAMQSSGYRGVMMFEIKLYGITPAHPGKQNLYSTHLAWRKLMQLNGFVAEEKSDEKAWKRFKDAEIHAYDVGTSAALTGTTQEGYEAARNAGFQWVEVIIPNDIHLQSDQEIAAWAREQRTAVQASGLKLWSVHLPYGTAYDLSATDSLQSATAVRQQERALGLLKILKPQVAVLHACSGKITPQERESRKASFVQRVKPLAAEYRKAEVTLALETLPADYLGNTSQEILEMIQGIPNLGVCLDINHIMLEDHSAAIRSLGKSIVTTHLSDHDAQADRHWLPYLGRIDWKSALRALTAVNYEGVMLFEVSARPKHPKAGYPAQTIEMCMQAWQRMKQEF